MWERKSESDGWKKKKKKEDKRRSLPYLPLLLLLLLLDPRIGSIRFKAHSGPLLE